ncbi:MAG: hypothetical protein LCI00_19060 [Chloroflexi bacterium]|nr:hypothetical protein [Chloroflexota bacterium]MCC6894178.1 hypothetical protein [Anaerolineae bacterium]
MNSFLNTLFNLFRGSSITDQLTALGIRTTQNAETIGLQNSTGQQINLNKNSITIQDTNGNTVTLDSDGVHIQAAANIKMDASQMVINSSLIQINSGMVKVSGTVQCDTIIANTVAGTTYTPGAGNIW